MKRILSILLVLAMLLSMVPAVFAADCDITVSTPAPDPVKVGALYQLPLGTVFTDPNGHALSFALKADYGDKVYIKDNTLQFTSAEAGEFRIGITATCTGGGSAEVVVPITVEAVEDGGKNQYGYDETDQASVTVYVTISSDGAPIIGKDDGGTILSHLEVKVPYFPLSLYGLDDFNRYHTENGSGSYTDNEIVQRPTLLHLYIYMLERYYLGVAEKDCGKGTYGLLEFTGSGEGVNDMLGGSYKDTLNALLISGSATSMYMQNFWGHDENLMYYRNHVYPLMSAGWGSTADYILLSDNFAYRAFMTTGAELSKTTWDNPMTKRYPDFNNEKKPVKAEPGAQGYITQGANGGLPDKVRHGAFVNVPESVLKVTKSWTAANPTHIEAVDSTTKAVYNAGTRELTATVTAADKGTLAGSVKFSAGDWSKTVKLDAEGKATVTLPASVSGTVAVAYDGYTDGLVNPSDTTVDGIEQGKVDLAELNKQIAAAEALKESDYTSDSWAKLAAALVESRPLRIEGGSYRLCEGGSEHCGRPGCRRRCLKGE